MNQEKTVQQTFWPLNGVIVGVNGGEAKLFNNPNDYWTNTKVDFTIGIIWW